MSVNADFPLEPLFCFVLIKTLGYFSIKRYNKTGIYNLRTNNERNFRKGPGVL